MGDWGSKIVGGGRLGAKNCGRWEIGGQKLWEVGDGHPCVTPLLGPTEVTQTNHAVITLMLWPLLLLQYE